MYFFFINTILEKNNSLANVMYFDDCKTFFLNALAH